MASNKGDDIPWIKSQRMLGIKTVPMKSATPPPKLDEGDCRLFDLDHGFGLDDTEKKKKKKKPVTTRSSGNIQITYDEIVQCDNVAQTAKYAARAEFDELMRKYKIPK
jgi:hypothetical protein